MDQLGQHQPKPPDDAAGSDYQSLASFAASMAVHCLALVTLALLAQRIVGGGHGGDQITAIAGADSGTPDGDGLSLAGDPTRPGDGGSTDPAELLGPMFEGARGVDEAGSDETNTISPPDELTSPLASNARRLPADSAGLHGDGAEPFESATDSNLKGGNSASDGGESPNRGKRSPFPHPGGGLDGRGRGRRGAGGHGRGGPTPETEAAVEKGLRWLAAHQRRDGSWHFQHQDDGICQYCPNGGTFVPTTAATGLALLAFLGAGQTHKSGEYQGNVERGLYYLGERMLITEHGGDLTEGNMYAQGIATIALCEALAMTDDRALRPFAESAVEFILHAQDPKGGGWRYTPGQPGDTTMHGWQIMALKSAHQAGIAVPYDVTRLADSFLDSVQSEYGSAYGYQSREKGKTTSAIGLLCRMYLGWTRKHPGVARGVEVLNKIGPAETDMYYNYYATQVLWHYGGGDWNRWNNKMRDWLVATQATTGHAAGSWFFDRDEHAAVGGRLYCTTLAIMTLEIYYRYLPLYGDVTDGKF